MLKNVNVMTAEEVEAEMDSIIEANGPTGRGRFIQLRNRLLDLYADGYGTE